MSPRNKDAALRVAARAAAVSAAAIVAVIAGFLVLESLPALRTVNPARWLTGDGWQPTAGRFNLAPMIAGTLVVTLGSVLIAGPLGVLAAIFNRFYAPPRMAGAYRQLLGVLAGVPPGGALVGAGALVNVASASRSSSGSSRSRLVRGSGVRGRGAEKICASQDRRMIRLQCRERRAESIYSYRERRGSL